MSAIETRRMGLAAGALLVIVCLAAVYLDAVRYGPAVIAAGLLVCATTLAAGAYVVSGGSGRWWHP